MTRALSLWGGSPKWPGKGLRARPANTTMGVHVK
jgi:hypothetical protein